ncbi:MAG: phage tail tube protein [Robiginitomaculum sp.]|nr:phage tail tube protein [Robiginitomaculum sp.]
MTAATSAFGVVVSIGQGDAATVLPGVDVFDAIGELTSCQSPNETRERIEVTNFDSAAKEFISGLKDGGEAQFEMNFVPGDAGQASVRAAFDSGQLRNFRIVFTDAATTTLDFKVLVLEKPVASGGVGEALTASMTVKVSGAVTWT